VRKLNYGSEGWGFESSRPHHSNSNRMKQLQHIDRHAYLGRRGYRCSIVVRGRPRRRCSPGGTAVSRACSVVCNRRPIAMSVYGSLSRASHRISSRLSFEACWSVRRGERLLPGANPLISGQRRSRVTGTPRIDVPFSSKTRGSPIGPDRNEPLPSPSSEGSRVTFRRA